MGVDATGLSAQTHEGVHSVTPVGGGQMIELLRRHLQHYSFTNAVQEEQAIKEMLLVMGKEFESRPMMAKSLITGC